MKTLPLVRSLVWGMLGAAGLGTGIVTVSGFLSRYHGLLDLTSHFRAQYLAASVVLVVIFALGRKRRSTAMIAVLAGVNAVVVVPLYVAPQPLVGSPVAEVRLMLANVLTSNRDSARVLQAVHDFDPDVFVALEIDQRWIDELRPLSTEYPHTSLAPRDDNFGIGLYSKGALTDPEVVHFGAARLPSIVSRLTVNDTTITVIATHPPPPFSPARSQLRNEQLAELASIVRNLDGPVVVLGDLNLTPWSYYFGRLLSDAGLIDSTRGFGLQPTWPSNGPAFPRPTAHNSWLLRIPIDHCLFTDDVRAADRQIGPFIGSDHFPLVVDLEVAGELLPAPTAGPPGLVMDIADARSTAIAWSVPGQSPRVERSGYIDAGRAITALRGQPNAVYLHDSEGEYLDKWLAERGGPLVMLELSQQGMDIDGVAAPHHTFRQADAAPRTTGHGANCEPVPRKQRYSITAFFDPRRGNFVGHDHGAAPEALWAVATPRLDHRIVTATVSPTATPSPYGTPPRPSETPRPTAGPLIDPSWPAEPLQTGEYLVGVAEMIRVWPLVKGSRWTYRSTSHMNQRVWRTEVITETVVEATRLGPNVMLVEIEETFAASGSAQPASYAYQRLVLSDRVMVGHRGRRPLRTLEELVASGERPWNPDQSSVETIARLPLQAEDAYLDRGTRVTGRVGHLTTGAGRFAGCVELIDVAVGGGNAWGQWLCPGVGIARHERPACSVTYGGYTVRDLIGWSVPPLLANR